MRKIILFGILSIGGCSNIQVASNACPGDTTSRYPRAAMVLDSHKQCDVVLNTNKSSLITNQERKVHR